LIEPRDAIGQMDNFCYCLSVTVTIVAKAGMSCNITAHLSVLINKEYIV